MKNKIQPTNKERVMRDSDFIVSKTDTKGRITYGNQTFIEFSGFSEKELINTQHNIIRHPDMPRGVFEFLWQTIKTGKEFSGYVKNMSKDGGFYWVFANVTASFDPKKNIIGYYSVRRKPSREAINVASSIYKEMLQVEQNSVTKDATSNSIGLLVGKLQKLGIDYDTFVHSI